MRPWLFAGAWGGASLYLLIVASDYLRAPVHGEWEPVLAMLGECARPGEAVVFEPDWLRGYATDLNKFKAYRVYKDAAAAAADAQVTGVLVVSPFSEPDVPGGLRARFGVPARFKVNGYQVAVSPARAAPAGLHHQLDQARVWLDGPHHDGVWQQHAIGFQDLASGTRQWQDVRLSSQIFEGKRKQGLWFHPPIQGALVAEWDLPESGTLLIEGGLPDVDVRAERSYIDLQVSADGRELTTLRFANERGWFEHRVPLGGARTLRLAASSPNNHGRHLHLRPSIER